MRASDTHAKPTAVRVALLLLRIKHKWRVRRRLLYWYGRLKALESVIEDAQSRETLAEYREEFAVIDRAVCNIPIPLSFSDQYYNLRSAIDVVRQRLASLKPIPAAAEAA